MNHTHASRPLPVLLFSNAGVLRVPVHYEGPEVVSMLFDGFTASLRASKQWADVRCKGLDLGGDPALGMQPLRDVYKALMDQKIDRFAFFKENAFITYEAAIELRSSENGTDSYMLRISDAAVPLTSFRGEVMLRVHRAGQSAGLGAALKADVLAHAHRKCFEPEHLCHAKNMLVELYIQGNYKGIASLEAPAEMSALRAEYPEKTYLHARSVACMPLTECDEALRALRDLDQRKITQNIDLVSLLLCALICYVLDVHVPAPVLVGPRPHVIGFLCALREGCTVEGAAMPDPRHLLRSFARFGTTRSHLSRLAKGLLTVLEEYTVILQQRQAVLLPMARHILRWAPQLAGEEPLQAAAKAATDTIRGACLRLQEVIACMANPEANKSALASSASPLNEDLMYALPVTRDEQSPPLSHEAPDEDVALYGEDDDMMLPCLDTRHEDNLDGLCL